jgi:hypothetical protein
LSRVVRRFGGATVQRRDDLLTRARDERSVNPDSSPPPGGGPDESQTFEGPFREGRSNDGRATGRRTLAVGWPSRS